MQYLLRLLTSVFIKVRLDEKIGFIGGANMAFAIGPDLINRGIIETGQN